MKSRWNSANQLSLIAFNPKLPALCKYKWKKCLFLVPLTIVPCPIDHGDSVFYSGTSTAKSHQLSSTAVEMGKRGELLDEALNVGLFLAGGQHKAVKFPFHFCNLELFQNKIRSIIKLPEEQHKQ